MQFIDEQNDLPFCVGDFFQNGLQPVFEFAAIFCARHQRRQIQRHKAFGLQHLRHVPGNDALRQPFHDGCLAHAGLANQHRIVLGAPGEDLHHTANLLVAPDYGIEFRAPCQVREVARVFFQCFIRRFWVLRRDALRSPYTGQRLEDGFVRGALLFQQFTRGIAFLPGNRQKKMLGRDVFILELFGLVEGLLQDFV